MVNLTTFYSWKNPITFYHLYSTGAIQRGIFKWKLHRCTVAQKSKIHKIINNNNRESACAYTLGTLNLSFHRSIVEVEKNFISYDLFKKYINACLKQL